jgi:hypothetical protein
VPIHFTAFHPDYKLSTAPPRRRPRSPGPGGSPWATACASSTPVRPRPGRVEHLLPEMRGSGHRARLVPSRRLPADRRRALPVVRMADGGHLRRSARTVGAAADGRTAGGTTLTAWLGAVEVRAGSVSR